MITTAELEKTIDPGIRKHFVDGYKAIDFDVNAIYSVGKQESKSDEYQNYTGITKLSPVAEGQDYTEDSPIQAYGTTLTVGKYGKLLKVTDEEVRYSKTKDIFNNAKLFGKASKSTVQTYAAKPFVRGYDTTYTSLTDGKPLFSTGHLRADGGTAQSNASSTSVVFSETNLEVGLLALENVVDNRGELIEVMADQIVIPNALRKSVGIVLKSEGRSGTANNDVNVYKGMITEQGTLRIRVWDYIAAKAGGSDTAWFLQDTSVENLMWQWEEKPNISRDNSIGFKADVVYYKARTYFSLGWRDWVGLWGSKGTGVAYSN